MPNRLLSTYRAGENRVTASTMAVFERLDLALVQELLEAAADAAGDLNTVTFENQVVQTGAVPDARISARFTWWFETKTARGSYANDGHDRQQLRLHANHLRHDPDARLFVLTPDPVKPAWFNQLDGIDEAVRPQILWISFKSVADAVSAITTDPARLVAEQSRFLLTELVALYEADGLLTNDDTVVVAARSAWPEYLKLSAYVCQPDRSFREGLTHLGFYADGHIKPLVPRIRAHYPAVPFTYAEVDGLRAEQDAELAELVRTVLDRGARAEGESFGVLLLSAPDDDGTVHLSADIANDTTTAAGKPWAWTLGQRYTSLDRLRSGVTVTSQL